MCCAIFSCEDHIGKIELVDLPLDWDQAER
eukprot:COSAG05_NODE_2401_length_3105_cov_49.631684_2_plen_30_part_00